MTKYLLTLTTFILIMSVSNGQTNVYHPFPDSNAHWSEYSNWLVGGGPCWADDSYTLFILGDTVVDTKTYHKIYQSGFIFSNCPPPGYYYYNVYKGAFRQDTTLKQVFFLTGSNSTEVLWYDFNLNVGDTLPNSNFIVSGIDSALVGNNYHKSFIVNECDGFDFLMIEGVGFTSGFRSLPYCPFESFSQLQCFGYNGQYYPANSNCTFALSITETNYETFQISFSPNPFSTQTTLRTDYILEDATLTLYNSLGQQIRQVNNINGQTLTLNRDNLSSGLYYLQLTQDNQTIATDKLVIAD